MKTTSKYIYFQLLGWCAFVLFNLYFAYSSSELNINTLFINILLGAWGVVLTHFYKKLIQSKKWLELSTESLIQKVLSAIVLKSILFNIFYYIILFVLHPFVLQSMYLANHIGNFISMYLLFGIWNFIYFTWFYIEKNKQMQIDSLKLQSELKDLELKTIRSNLQPHFIFNSLNSIRALIDENPLLAREAVTKISNILRRSITNQKISDTLENELLLLEDYISLEKIRYEDRLHFEKQIDKNTLSCLVPTMMLQTLTENAIKHGISLLQNGGNILIKTFIVEDKLNIIIENNTPIEAITQHEDSLGFGISSTQQRLFLLYKNDATLHLNIKNGVAKLEIKLPITNI